MSPQTVQIELPSTLLERARVQAPDEARELITFLLEEYVQELEKSQRLQAYETYYAARTPEDEAEELELLADFAFAEIMPPPKGGCCIRSPRPAPANGRGRKRRISPNPLLRQH